ncbi:MAG: hypothetical protein GY810_09010 [Aureispira sp.]|nr:hypothetical protein [Aureispira sp.]
MKNKSSFLLSFSILPIGLFFLVVSKWYVPYENTDSQSSAILTGEKQKGAHVFGIFDTTNFEPLIQNNLEWITMVSWGFQENCNTPAVTHHNGDSVHIVKHDSIWVERLKMVRAAGFKVFLKPHLWIDAPAAGKWRSDIFPTNEENWKLWKESYTDFILRYAKVAEKAEVEMFCIGTEFSRLSTQKSKFWEKLIQDVRVVYSGKITYAANWYNEFEKITLWKELDFIGIQAYFPLVKNNNPSVGQLSKGWNRYIPSMQAVHEKYKRQILFTEMGYKSTASSAIKPWEWVENSSDLDKLFSAKTQANCYKAFFETIWKREWFAGVHIWQMRGYPVKDSDYNNLDFTVQGKPAENIIAKGFE